MTRKLEIPAELLDEMTPAVQAFVESLLATIAAQQKRIEELEQRLGMNSGNSSMPPSSDGPGQKPAQTSKRKSKRKRGGQFGHPKRTRPLIPTAECDQVKHHRPTACSGCGTALCGNDSDPERHQITELPPIRPVVIEHQVHTLECPCCGRACRGHLPRHVPRGSFGPGVVAAVTLLSSVGRLSQRIIGQLLEELFQLNVSGGQISRLQSIGRKALQSAYQEIAADVRSSAAVNVDETSWRENGSKAWLWTAVGRRTTLFGIYRSRARKSLHELLGKDFGGIIGSDRYSAYSHLEDHRHQFCWAHLLRDFQAMIDRGGQSKKVGHQLKRSGQELIHHWNRLQAQEISRSTFRHYFRQLQSQIMDALHRGAFCNHAKTAETCRRLGNECYSLFVFVDHSDVAPTNNSAEQALRKSVIFRKLSFGTEQQTGSRNHSVIMSVVETCRRLNRPRFRIIREAVQALYGRKPAPVLLSAN